MLPPEDSTTTKPAARASYPFRLGLPSSARPPLPDAGDPAPPTAAVPSTPSADHPFLVFNKPPPQDPDVLTLLSSPKIPPDSGRFRSANYRDPLLPISSSFSLTWRSRTPIICQSCGQAPRLPPSGSGASSFQRGVSFLRSAVRAEPKPDQPSPLTQRDLEYKRIFLSDGSILTDGCSPCWSLLRSSM